jgi:hypothetical protein
LGSGRSQTELLRDSFERRRRDGVENFLDPTIVDLSFGSAHAGGAAGVID